MDNSLLTVHPTTEANWYNENVRTEGLLLRDYLAAKAMQAMISNPSMMDNASDGAVNYVTSASYKFADAMLSARAISKATGE